MGASRIPVLSRSALFAGLVLFLTVLSAPEVGARESSTDGRLVQPNPFRGGQVVEFTLTVPPPGHEISINVYDVLGKHIRQLFPWDPATHQEHHIPGTYVVPWDGNDKYGLPIVVGAYFCVLRSGNAIVRTVKVIKLS